MQKKEKKTFLSVIKGIIRIVWFLISLFFVFIFGIFLLGFLSLIFGSDVEIKSGNIAVIPISGVISSTSDAEGLISQGAANSKKISEWIKKADESDNIKAIILEINSPGGSPVATDEIAQAVKKAKKPTVAIIRETGTSGAFWVATSADTVFANRMSLTGSIGVLASRLEFAGLLKDYNITYRRIVAGKYKDAGSRFKEMTAEEQTLFQKTINQIHEYFIEEVANNRKLSPSAVRELATGFVFLGSEAKELGLIDYLGGREEAIKLLEEKLGIKAEIAEFKDRAKLFDFFGSVMNENFYFLGQGIGSVLFKSRAYEQFEVWT